MKFQLLHLWALRKSSLSFPQDRQVLKVLFGFSTAIQLAYDLLRQLTALFDQPLTQAGAKVGLHAWIEQVHKSDLY